RQRGPDKVQIGVVTGTAASTAVIKSLARDSTLVVSTFDDSAAARALRTGKVALVVVPGSANDSVRYIDYLIPGLLGMNLMGSSIWGLGFSIVTARSKKLLKRLMATPMSRAQYLLSFLCSRLVFLILEVVTLLGFGHWAFGVPLRGSLGTLFLIALLGAVSFGGLGLLNASRARTT